MVQVALIGIGAGFASALLYLAPLGGSAVAFPLFVLTGLPLAIAGLGWGTTAGAVALVVGSLVTYLAIGTHVAPIIFALVFAAPVVWLSHLATLSRAGPDGTVEWYPLGRLLLHATLAVAVGLVAAALVGGYEPDGLMVAATAALDELMVAAQGGIPADPESVQAMAEFYVASLPFTLAAFLLATVVFNLWLGSVIARRSGRLARPAEPLWSVQPPVEIAIGFVITLVLAFVIPWPLGGVAAVLSGALGGGLVMVGLAVLHAVTIGTTGRAALLTGAYVLTFLSGLPLALLAMLGIAETLLDLRARRAARGKRP